MTTAARPDTAGAPPARHYKVLRTKAKTSGPWVVAWGFLIRHETPSGRRVLKFRSETIVSEHATREAAEEAVARLTRLG
ncbi:hypothetical protein WDZ92_42625, partial [Nostoc sp. NIES-2111]